MKPTFDRVAGETFDVSIGCYSDADAEIRRIEIRGESEGSVRAAREWFLDQPEIDGQGTGSAE